MRELTDYNRWVLTDEEKEEYMKIMDVSGTGIMGYVEIPAIDCELPVYHGVDEAVLQIAIGHIEGALSQQENLERIVCFLGTEVFHLQNYFQIWISW